MQINSLNVVNFGRCEKLSEEFESKAMACGRNLLRNDHVDTYTRFSDDIEAIKTLCPDDGKIELKTFYEPQTYRLSRTSNDPFAPFIILPTPITRAYLVRHGKQNVRLSGQQPLDDFFLSPNNIRLIRESLENYVQIIKERNQDPELAKKEEVIDSKLKELFA